MLEFLGLITEFLQHLWFTMIQCMIYVNQSIGYLTSTVGVFPTFISAALLAFFSIFLLRFILLR